MTRWGAALSCVLLCGCSNGWLAGAARPGPYQGGRTETLAPPGTAPRGTAAHLAALAEPGPEPDSEVLSRGRERYAIYCTPCHGPQGRGDGAAVRHGFPAPPPLADPATSRAPREIVAVITHGQGRMYSLAERIPARDRWAIAHYVRSMAGIEPASVRDAVR